jgi:hypothetical protein
MAYIASVYEKGARNDGSNYRGVMAVRVVDEIFRTI